MRKAITRLMLKEISAGKTPNRLYYDQSTNVYQGIISGGENSIYTTTIKNLTTNETVSATTSASRIQAGKVLVHQLSGLGVGFAVQPIPMELGPAYSDVLDVLCDTTELQLGDSQIVTLSAVDGDEDPVDVADLDCPNFYVTVKNLTPELITIQSKLEYTKAEIVDGEIELIISVGDDLGEAKIEVNFGGLVKVITIDVITPA